MQVYTVKIRNRAIYATFSPSDSSRGKKNTGIFRIPINNSDKETTVWRGCRKINMAQCSTMYLIFCNFARITFVSRQIHFKRYR